MKGAFFTVALMLSGLHAAEVSLYDCDYIASSSQIGQSIPLASTPMPGRKACSGIPFGEVIITNAPSPWSGTAAMMRPLPTGSTGSMCYSQMSFVMLSGSVYAFRKHRIETVFRFLSSEPGDAMTIHTDGGVTYALNFDSSGSVTLSKNVMAYGTTWGDRIEIVDQSLAPFDPSQPVHLIWETDIDGGKTIITINGNATTVTGLSPQPMGLRNGQMYPGPLYVRMNFSSTGTTRHLALRSVRITGDDYDGPLFVAPDAGITENDVATARFVHPPVGTWQPQFSIDGKTWKNYAQPVSSDFTYDWISFGTRVGPKMLFRVKRVAK